MYAPLDRSHLVITKHVVSDFPKTCFFFKRNTKKGYTSTF